MNLKLMMQYLSILIVTPCCANSLFSENTFIDQVSSDYVTYFSGPDLLYLSTGVAIGALFANTSLDQSIQNEWQNHWRHSDSNHFSNSIDKFSQSTQFGVFLPIYLASMWLGKEYPHGPGSHFLGVWGNHSLRTYLLGAPQQAILTVLLGGRRPENGSHWHPFYYTRAVSGHAFYGAIPFLNLAKSSDNFYLKSASYGLSLLPGLARINNNKHYFSQAFLGWWLAFSSTQIVWLDKKVSKKSNFISWNIFPTKQTIYLSVDLNF